MHTLKTSPSRTGGRLLAAALAALAAMPAWAGRPLAVDDANTNDAGRGHLELWATRAPGSTVLNAAPAYAVFDGVELGGAYARENGTRVSVSALQLKWRITPSKDDGCNIGATFGVTRTSHGIGRGNYLNGLFSCNGVAGGSLHANLGAVKAVGFRAAGTWGIAYERALGGITPHIEWFGTEGGKPTAQIGVRGDVVPGLQLDGSVGRSDGEKLYSLGLKKSF